MPGKDPLPITLVIAPRFPFLSLAICTEFLRVANREAGRALFSRTVITEDGAPVASSSGMTITPHAAIADIGFAPVVVVLASYDPQDACSAPLLAWLRRQDRRGAVFACADTGAYVLARAGVLRGRRAAVHHEALPGYRESLGESILLDRAYGADRDLYSSGGGMATADMMLRLIARFNDEALAERVAAVLNHRPPSEYPSGVDTASLAAVSRVDPRLGRMVEVMHANLAMPLPLREVCRLAAVDPSTARRLALRHLGEAPGRYYSNLRLDRARMLLGHSALPINEIAMMAGYGDASAFARAYRRRFGILPSHARVSAAGA